MNQGNEKRNTEFSLGDNNVIKHTANNIDNESYNGCGYENFVRLRNLMEEFFKKVSSPIDSYCVRDKTYEQMLTETTGLIILRPFQFILFP